MAIKDKNFHLTILEAGKSRFMVPTYLPKGLLPGYRLGILMISSHRGRDFGCLWSLIRL